MEVITKNMVVNENQENQENQEKVKNKGTGAGGSNTAIGTTLEVIVRDIISKNITKIKGLPYNNCKNKWKVEEVEYNQLKLIHAPEAAFKCYETNCGHADDKIKKAHGAKEPDDALIDEEHKTIHWFECKVQNGTGSVAEKLQTCGEKIINLERRFPGYKINYNYILVAYLRAECEWEILRLDEKEISYVFDDDNKLEEKILDMIK